MFRVQQARRPHTWTPPPGTESGRWAVIAIVTGLKPYESFWFRIVALGIDTEGLPSDVVLGRPA